MSDFDLDPSEATEAPPLRRSSEHWTLLAFSILGLISMLGFAFYLQPDARGHGTHEQLGLSPCFPMEYWNVPCPGCGVTTAVTHAAHLNFVASVRTQPFGFLLAILGPAFGLWAIYQHLRGRDIWMQVAMRGWERAWAPALGLLLLAWLYKLAVVRSWF